MQPDVVDKNTTGAEFVDTCIVAEVVAMVDFEAVAPHNSTVKIAAAAVGVGFGIGNAAGTHTVGVVHAAADLDVAFG